MENNLQKRSDDEKSRCLSCQRCGSAVPQSSTVEHFFPFGSPVITDDMTDADSRTAKQNEYTVARVGGSRWPCLQSNYSFLCVSVSLQLGNSSSVCTLHPLLSIKSAAAIVNIRWLLWTAWRPHLLMSNPLVSTFTHASSLDVFQIKLQSLSKLSIPI